MSRAAPRSHAARSSSSSAGFTLIEALVAVAVAVISLSAIASLIAGNIRGAGRIAQHLSLSATLRAVEAALPERASLGVDNLAGDMHGEAWTVDVVPFPNDAVNPRAGLWTPQEIVIAVQSPSGGELRLETIRLTKRAGGQ